MVAIRQGVGETAMVCGFTHKNGGWRLAAVTAAEYPGAPSILMTKEHGQETIVKVYYSVVACDRAFLRLVDRCTEDGFQHMGQVEMLLPDLLFNPEVDDSVAVMERWADQLLRSASFKLVRQHLTQ